MVDYIQKITKGHVKSEELIPSFFSRVSKFVKRKIGMRVPILPEGFELSPSEAVTIVDVGANFGQFSKKAIQAYPNCNLTIVEPQAELVDAMRSRFSGSKADITYCRAGVSDRKGELVLNIVNNSGGSSFLPMTDQYISDNPNLSVVNTEIVNVETLDVLLKHIKKIDILKIDVEGMEDKVLTGAQKTVEKTNYIFLEFGLNRYDSPLHVVISILKRLEDSHKLICIENLHYNAFGELACFDAVFANVHH